MSKEPAPEYVLWAHHVLLGKAPIKLTGGSLRECRSEQTYRQKLNCGYTMGIYRKGDEPIGLRERVAEMLAAKA